jgi:hypothetical protein
MHAGRLFLLYPICVERVDCRLGSSSVLGGIAVLKVNFGICDMGIHNWLLILAVIAL